MHIFHSLHHTQFRTNFCLFMPFYDYLYYTMDKSSDALYEKSLKGNNLEIPQVVYLTHPTSMDSIYHLRLGLASLASKPYSSKWYLLIIKPLTFVFVILTWVFGSTFTLESINLDKLRIETWAIPTFSFHYHLSWQKKSINDMIEKAILEADCEGVKVMSLGLYNQSEELNKNGKLYLQKHPKLKVRLVDGTALASEVVLNSIPKGTEIVIMRGQGSKASYAIVLGLCKKGIKVATVCKFDYQELKTRLPTELWSNIVLTGNYDIAKVWLVGNGITDKEQKKAPKRACFIPYSQIPIRNLRKDCFYHTIPAMRAPKNLVNMHACENELPRRVMSAWRVAGIIHALEGWDAHECGDTILEADKVWNAALRHGFLPLT